MFITADQILAHLVGDYILHRRQRTESLEEKIVELEARIAKLEKGRPR